MDEIRKKLEDAKELLEAGLDESVYEAIDEALALLLPERKTRGDQCPRCGPVGCAECYGTGRLSGYQAHADVAEPVPSSEKALRDAYEQGLANMSANFPAAKEVLIDKVLETIYKWSTEHEYQVTPPYDWAELGKRLRLLASHPVPSNKGAPDGPTD